METYALDKGCIDIATQVIGFQPGDIFCRYAPNIPVFHFDQLEAPLLFDDLGVSEVSKDSPDWLGLVIWFRPFTKMGGERIEVVL